MGLKVRSIDWRDLPALHRYRNRYAYLDSTRLLTRGPEMVPLGALFSYFNLATGLYTFHCKADGDFTLDVIGQVYHPAGKASARLSFLVPDSVLESPALTAIIESMTTFVGKRGAFHLLAEVDEENFSFTALHRAGFAIYARQKVWQLTGDPIGKGPCAPWRQGVSSDIIGVRSLYCNVVPGLVQQIEPSPVNRLRGYVLLEGGELKGYVELIYGPRGIWAQPFIHPDMENVTERLAHLLHNLPRRGSRPVYLCVRSYQSWLEPFIEDLGAEAGPRQAVMVKRLATPQKAPRAYLLPALERGHPEITAPMTHSRVKSTRSDGMQTSGKTH